MRLFQLFPRHLDIRRGDVYFCVDVPQLLLGFPDFGVHLVKLGFERLHLRCQSRNFLFGFGSLSAEHPLCRRTVAGFHLRFLLLIGALQFGFSESLFLMLLIQCSIFFIQLIQRLRKLLCLSLLLFQLPRRLVEIRFELALLGTVEVKSHR